MAATKRSPRKRNTKARAPDVAVKVDARLKKLWDKTLADIREAQQKGAGSFDRLWEAAASVVDHDPPLYVLGGYASAAEFFDQVLHEDERAARRFIRVARYATPAEEDKYGTSVLDAALGYVEARIGKPLDGPLPVAFDRLKIEVNREGKKARLPLEQLTVAEIAAAAKALRKTGKAASRASETQRAMSTALGAVKALSEVHVQERNGLASFSRVPVAQLKAFAKRLLAVKLPAQAPAKTKAKTKTKPT